MSDLHRHTLYIMNVTDLVSCILSFFLAYWIRFGLMTYDPSVSLPGYRDFIFIVAAAYVLVNLLSLYREDFLERSAMAELAAVIRMTFYLLLIVLVALNFAKANEHYSRVYELVFAGCLIIIDFSLRMRFPISIWERWTGPAKSGLFWRQSCSAENIPAVSEARKPHRDSCFCGPKNV